MAAVVAMTAAATEVNFAGDDNTPKRKRTRRHRNILQISEADVSVLNSLWEQDGFGQKNHAQQLLPPQHARTLKDDKEPKKGMGKKDKGMKEKKVAKKGKGMKGMMEKGMKKDKIKLAGRIKKETQSFSFYLL